MFKTFTEYRTHLQVLEVKHFAVLQPHRRPDYVGNGTWHDEVDLSRYFQETAVLYTICVIFWILAALRFYCYVKLPHLPYSWLNVTKIVSDSNELFVS